MTPALQEFHDALIQAFAFVAPEHRPSLTVKEIYEPILSPGLPVTAILIGDKYAAYQTMWQHHHGADVVIKVEKFQVEIDPRRVRQDEDPHEIAANHNPHFVAWIVVHDLLQDFSWPLQQEWKKKQPWYKPKKEG